jgi:hypothetical protein
MIANLLKGGAVLATGKLAYDQYKKHFGALPVALVPMPQILSSEAMETLSSTDWLSRDEESGYDAQLMLFNCSGIDARLKMWANESLHPDIKKMIAASITKQNFEDTRATLKQMSRQLKPLDYYSDSDAKQSAADALRDNYTLLYERSDAILNVLGEKTDDKKEKWELVAVGAESSAEYVKAFHKGL